MTCACSCGSGSIGRVLAVVGVVGLGVAGFNTLRSGCPLGTCSTSAAAAAVIPASNTPPSSTCTATCPTASADSEAKCPMTDAAAPTTTPEASKPEPTSTSH